MSLVGPRSRDDQPPPPTTPSPRAGSEERKCEVLHQGSPDEQYATPLQMAARLGADAIVQMLFDHG